MSTGAKLAQDANNREREMNEPSKKGPLGRNRLSLFLAYLVLNYAAVLQFRPFRNP
jgi:hypothetical protein